MVHPAGSRGVSGSAGASPTPQMFGVIQNAMKEALAGSGSDAQIMDKKDRIFIQIANLGSPKPVSVTFEFTAQVQPDGSIKINIGNSRNLTPKGKEILEGALEGKEVNQAAGSYNVSAKIVFGENGQNVTLRTISRISPQAPVPRTAPSPEGTGHPRPL